MKQRMMIVKAAVAAVALGSVATLTPGCLVAGSSKTYESGRYIGRDTIKRVKPGETDKNWVRAVLGEPSSMTYAGEQHGAEIWRYESRKVHKSGGSVFLLFHGSDRTETTRTVYIQFDGDVVEDVWSD